MNTGLTLSPNKKVGSELMKQAVEGLKQDTINYTVDYIKKELAAIETCNYEIDRWIRLREKYQLRIEALKAGQFSVGYHGVKFDNSDLENPTR